jgi:hypothetical protein
MSELGLQPREVWKQPDRLPAEEKLGNSENTNKQRRCQLFLWPTWPSLHIRHLLGIRSLVTSLDTFHNAKCIIGKEQYDLSNF